MMAMNKLHVTGKNFDLGKGEIGRIIRVLLCGKIMPLGNFGGGARLRGLLALLLSHTFGGIIFPLLVPFEDKLHHLYQRLRKQA
jgi:hypothetical protein